MNEPTELETALICADAGNAGYWPTVAGVLAYEYRTIAAKLAALESMGNVAIWHGSWAEHMGDKAGKPIVRITQMDDDGYELVGDDMAEGGSLSEAISDYLANVKHIHR